MRKTIFRLALITLAVLLVAVALRAKTPEIAACCPQAAQLALIQTVRRASITEIKNAHPYILIALTAPFSHGM